jgi:hypothetical protein
MLAAAKERRALQTGGIIIVAFNDVDGADMAAVDAEDPVLGHVAPSGVIVKKAN